MEDSATGAGTLQSSAIARLMNILLTGYNMKLRMRHETSKLHLIARWINSDGTQGLYETNPTLNTNSGIL